MALPMKMIEMMDDGGLEFAEKLCQLLASLNAVYAVGGTVLTFGMVFFGRLLIRRQRSNQQFDHEPLIWFVVRHVWDCNLSSDRSSSHRIIAIHRSNDRCRIIVQFMHIGHSPSIVRQSDFPKLLVWFQPNKFIWFEREIIRFFLGNF